LELSKQISHLKIKNEKILDANPQTFALAFSGQGSQYPQMGIELYTYFPVFRSHFNLILSHFKNYFNEDLFLIQHNAGCNQYCGAWWFCGSETCALCGKNSVNCPICNTGGSEYVCNSDERLKENVVLVGKSQNGINIYQFNYIGRDGLYEGVIAQELLNTDFESALVVDEDGLYSVNYDKLDVEFKKIN
jgi:hypothetical protein